MIINWRANGLRLTLVQAEGKASAAFRRKIYCILPGAKYNTSMQYLITLLCLILLALRVVEGKKNSIFRTDFV